MKDFHSYLAIFLILFYANIKEVFSQNILEDISVTRITLDSNYNAFTSLVRFKGKFYCAFRTSDKHAYGKDGVIRIMSSRKGKKWKDIDKISVLNHDLRDPKLSVTPDNKIMLLMGGSIYKKDSLLGGVPHVAFSSKKGRKFHDAMPVKLDANTRTGFDWLWEIKWNNDIGYGGIYKMGEDYVKGDTSKIELVKTKDGINYELFSKLEITEKPSEVSIAFGNEVEMVILIRRHRRNKAYLAKSNPPYTNWSHIEMPNQVQGPHIIHYKEDQFIGGGRINGKTTLFLFSKSGAYKNIIILPSKRDNSYPGLVLGDEHLFVSYYSAHETKNPTIYFAKIPLSYFKF